MRSSETSFTPGVPSTSMTLTRCLKKFTAASDPVFVS